VLSAADKYQTVELARRQGIPVPRTWLVNSANELGSLSGLSFPLVVKDRFSMRWRDGRGTPGSVSYAFREAELRNIVDRRLRAAGDVLVQEFVAGTGVGFSLFIIPDEIFVPFQWERIREVDPRGSASSARKSVPPDPSLLDRSHRLLQSIGFLGIAMVEYKISSNEAVFMEINGRPWGSIGLAIASGIDYPRYFVDWYLQGTLPPHSIAYKDVTCRRLVSELTHLSNVRRGKRENWPGEYPEFWSTLARVAIPWYPGMCYDDLWISDPRPGLAQLWNWFQVRKKP
jgi:predicted ATP-grasp superfamily ATP-dependent carboligase